MTFFGEARSALGAVTEFLVFDPGAQAYANERFGPCEALLADLRETAAVRRLRGVSQLGLKRGVTGIPSRLVPFCDGRAHQAVALAPFSRFEHSCRVAERMLAFCALHRVPADAARDAAAASLLHDVGHPPFSHTLERVLVRHGVPDHESVGRRIVREDPEIQGAFRRHDVRTERVLSVIREEGDLGTRQKIADTCAYLEHDGRIVGMPAPPGFAQELLGSIEAVEDGICTASDLGPLERFLERRARLAADAYEHAYNRVNTLLLSEAADWLVRNGRLSLVSAAEGEDAIVLWSLLEAVESGAPPWVCAARAFLLGQVRHLDQWRIRAGSEVEIRATAGSTSARSSFVLAPIDFTRKTIPVRTPDGFVVRLHAGAEFLADHHRGFHEITFAA